MTNRSTDFFFTPTPTASLHLLMMKSVHSVFKIAYKNPPFFFQVLMVLEKISSAVRKQQIFCWLERNRLNFQ